MRIKIKPEEIDLLGKFVRERSGIMLDQSKSYLFESRLSTIMEELGCSSYEELYQRAIRDYTGALAMKIIDAISTNETSFFRDKTPFYLLIHKLVPDFYEKSMTATLNILSAACSTGQEVYSAIMMLRDAGIMPPKFRMRIVAVDISDTVIAKASRGRYSKFELARGMDSSKLHRYFVPDGNEYVIKDEIRAQVLFRRANLLSTMDVLRLGGFDIVFCRNVAIYFSVEDKRRLFNNLASVMNRNAALLIGSTESMVGISERFVRQDFRGGIYYRKA